MKSPAQRAHAALEAVNNLLLIPLATIMALEFIIDPDSGTSRAVERSTFGIATLFLAEWALGLAVAESRRRYLTSPARLLDLVSSIPFGVVFQSVRLVRLARLTRVLRMAQRASAFRGYGARLVRAVGVVGSTMFAAAIAIHVIEPSTFPTMGDAMWWTMVTVSTVGYGDVVPSTGAGRVVAGIAILLGIGTFGYLAGFAASVLDHDDDASHSAALERIERRLLAIEHSLNSGRHGPVDALEQRPSEPGGQAVIPGEELVSKRLVPSLGSTRG